MKKNSKNKNVFTFLHEPYPLNGDKDISVIFDRYLNDPERTVEIDGKTFYRAFNVVRVNNCVIAALDNRLSLKLGDSVTDELGNIFTVNRFEMLRFAGSFTDWYMYISFVRLLGNCESPGEYFAKLQ